VTKLDDQAELTEEEKWHLCALVLFYEAQGRDDLARQLFEQPVHIQRLSIGMYHQWLEHPEEFGAVYQRVFRFLRVIKAWVWAKTLVLKTKDTIQRALRIKGQQKGGD